MRMKRKHRYIIYKVSSDKSAAEIEKLGERDSTWEEFVESMPKNNSRWAIYDLEFNAADGRKQSKLCFIMYNPDDNADNAERFATTCNKDLFKQKVSEVNGDF